MNSKKQPKRSTIGTRFGALVALAGFVGVVGYVGSQTYRAATDSFVAPIILTPDNDIVISNKLKMGELAVDRMRATAQIESLDEESRATEKALQRLRALHATASNAIDWLKSVNVQQASAGVAERRTLSAQREVLTSMAEQQDELVKRTQASLEAGLVSRTDYAKEVQTLHQLRVALLDNERSRVQSDVAMHQVALAQRSLASRGGATPMPELLVREDEVVRIELEILKLEGEIRARTVEKRILQEKIAKLDEIETQLKGRPIVRAITKSMDVAFVPYTQIDGVKSGGQVYACTWGLLNCHPVGEVAEVVPGEVVLPDPWGNQARGQYVVLTLTDRSAAKAKSLRVRGGSPTPPSPADGAEAVSMTTRAPSRTPGESSGGR